MEPTSSEQPSHVEGNIPGQEILELITSSAVKKSLLQSSRTMQDNEYGSEIGFTVFRNINDNNINILKERAAEQGGVGFDEKNIRQYETMLEQQNLPVLDLHFHPSEPDGSYGYTKYRPSRADLNNLLMKGEIASEKGWDVSPINGVCLSQYKKIIMILYQKKSDTIASRSMNQDYYESSIGINRISEILEHLRNYGYNAEIITWTQNGFFDADQQKLLSMRVPYRRIE